MTKFIIDFTVEQSSNKINSIRVYFIEIIMKFKYLPFFKNAKLTCNAFEIFLVFVYDANITIYIMRLEYNISAINRSCIFNHVSKVLNILILKIEEKR